MDKAKLIERLNELTENDKSDIGANLDNSFDSGYWESIFKLIGDPELLAAYNKIYEATIVIFNEMEDYLI